MIGNGNGGCAGAGAGSGSGAGDGADSDSASDSGWDAEIMAERRFVVRRSGSGSGSVSGSEGGELIAGLVRVGRPRRHERGDWACRVWAEGLRSWSGPSEVFGADSWNALATAMGFLRRMAELELERGSRFEDGEGREWPSEGLFEF